MHTKKNISTTRDKEFSRGIDTKYIHFFLKIMHSPPALILFLWSKSQSHTKDVVGG